MKTGWIPIFFLLMSACIDPFPVDPSSSRQILVVDGMITDQPGPYTVKLSKTLALTNQVSNDYHETGATIVIHDDQGNQEQLVEATAGTYHTVNFSSAVGRKYYIEILTQSGATYQSSLEELLPVGDISDVRIEHEKNLSNVDGFQIYLDTDIYPEQKKLMLWQWTGTFEILTYPGARTKGSYNPATKITTNVPDPIPCSGLLPSGARIADCDCCNCWVTQFSDPPILSDPKLVVGNDIKDQKIIFIPINRRLFYNKYHVEIEQKSLSQTTYDFWKNVAIQKKTGSDLFQTPPPSLPSNISGTNEKSIPVMGVFAVCSVRKRVIEITKDQLPYVIPAIDSLIASCLFIYPNSTNIKPSFW